MFSLSVNRSAFRVLLVAGVLLAVSILAMTMLRSAFAQEDSGAIEYAENGTDPVAVFTATDPENMGAVVWSLGGDDADDFKIDKSGGVLSFKKSPDYEMATGGGVGGTANAYSVTVIATDADGIMSQKTVAIEVTNVDEAGKVSLDKVAPYPGEPLTALLSDPDSELISDSDQEWQWSRSRSKNGSYADIEGAKAAMYMPTSGGASGDVDYYLRASVSYKDGEGDGKSAMATSANRVQSKNVPNDTPAFLDLDPATRMVGENADAGANVGAPVAAADNDGDILTYTLSDTLDNESFEIDQATGQITVGDDTNVDFEIKQDYMVTVTATDPAGEPATIDVNINVSDDANEPPAIGGTVPDSIMEETLTLLVVTFTATDPDPNPDLDNRDIRWSLSGPDAGDFTITGGALTFRESPNYENPVDADGDNVYEVKVAATDADSNRGEKSVEVKVANVDEPGTVTLSAVQPRVGVSLTASLTDIDGGVSDLKWQWNRGDTSIGGAMSDTYTPAAADLTVTLTVTATYTDAEGAEKTVTVTAGIVAADTRNRAPVFDDQEAERTIAENARAGAQLNGGEVTATDPNLDDDLTYTLGGPDASSFEVSSVDSVDSVDATEGQITVRAGTKLDFETKATYMVTVIATDSFGVAASIDVTIKVTDENEGPAVTGPAEAEYAENGTDPVVVFTATDPENMGAVVWSLGGDDADDFKIDKSGGVLSFKKSPDYEMATGGGVGGTANAYSVTVIATDADGIMSQKTVAIEVTNVDEAGKVSLDKVAPYPGEPLTASLSDPDSELISDSGQEWQWSRSRSKNGSYADIEGAKAAMYMPTSGGASGDVDYYLRASVSYKDGEGDGKSAMATSANRVQLFNEPNGPPAFPDLDPATRMVGENADAGANVGAPVAAADNEGDILTYTLSDTLDNESFEIDQATGQITVGTGTKLDFETKATYMVTVIATDPAGESAPIDVNINVSDDANEPPAITDDVPASFDEGTAQVPAGSLVVATFMADDPDPDNNNKVIRWSLSGPDASDFTITGGALTFRESPNYENPVDADGDNVYEVKVAATDADSNRGEKSVEVKVANVDEPGTVTLSAVQPRVGVSLTASLTDIDGGVSDLKWQWNRGDTSIGGAMSDTYTPAAADLTVTLTVTATYTDAEGAEKTVTVTAGIVAADTRNRAPVFDDQDVETERTIAENARAGAQLNGGEVTATDPNLDDDLAYTLGGPDASSFEVSSVDATEGQITVRAGTKLDFETKATYMLTVTATDSVGVTASIDVTIKVTDENEGPEIMLGGLAISGVARVDDYAENGTDAVATYVASGPDASMATWSLEGDDAGDFEISNSGELTFVSAPDYENPADADMDNTYMVMVSATDGTYTATPLDVVVTVTDVVDEMERGLAISGMDSVEYAENGTDAVATYMASGPDASMATWSLDGDDAGQFEISSSGELTFVSAPDYETAADADMDNTYMVMVSATDGTYTATPLDVVVTVTNVVDEMPIIDDGTLLDRYDADDSGKIERDEVLDAIDIFFDSDPNTNITREEVLDLIDLFFVGLES